MRAFNQRFGLLLLFSVTILIVLIFQSYWLWSNFKNEKKDLLDHIEIKMQQTLINNLVFSESRKAKTGMDEKMHNEISEKIASLLNMDQMAGINTEIYVYNEKQNDSLSFISTSPNEKTDSLLYAAIHPYVQKTYGKSDLTIYHENGKIRKTFPAGRTFEMADTTRAVSAMSKSDETFRIHLPNLSYLIISKMYGSILFSFGYLLLFLGTLFLLYRNIKISQRLLKNKEVFTRNVTHELKIPISTIMITAEGFEKYNILQEPENVKKYIDTIKRAAGQLSFFVESILQNAKTESGNSAASADQIHLKSLLQDTESSLEQIIKQKNAQIIYENISDQYYLKGNYQELKQVFINLYDNAIKYATLEPEIRVSSKKLKNRILIQIKDNGIGISKKHTEDIFEPYFRITSGDLYEIKGFGLGLSFVKSALKKQKGKIRVSQSGGAGTIMELDLAAYE